MVRASVGFVKKCSGVPTSTIWPSAEVRERALAALRLVQMEHLAERPATALSGGQQQRVAIARALVGEPSLVLADEPTANLDSQVGAQILEMFRNLAKGENRALVIVTHDPKVRSIADRVIQIRDGRIAA